MNLVLAQPMAAQLNVQLRAHRLEGSPLVRDYYDAASALAPFFAGSPWDPAALSRVARRVQDHFDGGKRRALRDAIHPTSEAARQKLMRITGGEGFLVATGQQAGLFSGPLFTLYKTLTAVKAAEAFERALGVPVAPLFWVAADDHDFAEVNHAYVIGADSELHRIEVAGTDDVARSMHQRLLDESVEAAVESLASLLPATDVAREALGWVREAYVPGRSMAEAFTVLLSRIFARHDLLITSGAQPVVKALAAPVIARELEHSREHEAALSRQTARLLAAGYHEQVTVREDAANVLYEDADGRDRLIRENDSWHLSRSKRPFDGIELSRLLEQEPQRFSANVLLRPVVASEIFPTLAYVGGPAEISYFAQIGCLFELHGVPMPLVYPRASVDVIEHKVRKVLDKFALTVDDVIQPFDQLASRVVRDELPEDVSNTVSALRQQILDGYARLVAATEAIDPTLKGPLESARNASHKALADVEKKVVSHLKKKNEIGIEQLRKASTNVYPLGKSQERVLCGLSYLARYGTPFVDAAVAEIEIGLDAGAPEWQGVACG
ncbi:MAG: bacillithiol biosynthesis cysteine-adding enzyme BshC [Gemmatimonadota bacterium]